MKSRCFENKTDCFAYTKYGGCRACSETVFSGPCPFYKTSLQRLSEHQANLIRLQRMERRDLIHLYGEEGDQKWIWRDIYGAV